MKKSGNRISAFSVPALSVLCLAVMGTLPASGQDLATQPEVLTTPTVQQAVRFAVSPPLRDLKPEGEAFYGRHEVNPVLRPKLGLLKQLAAHAGTASDASEAKPLPPPLTLVPAAIGKNLVGVGNGFPGYFVPDAPSDVNLAVGATDVVQWVNVSYAVFDKATGAAETAAIPGNMIWSPLGGPCATQNSGDPIAQYDKLNHRFVLAQNTFGGGIYSTCVAVSKTDEAAGAYFLYEFPQPGFPDYPKWGIWSDAYYQSQNDFGPTGSAFVGVNVCAYQSSKMLVGDPTALQICFLDSSGGTLFDDSMLPADIDGTVAPPVGQPEVFLGSIDNFNPGTNVYEYLFHVDFLVPSNSTFTGENGTMPIAVNSYSLACGGFGACVKQKGVFDVLDSLGDRLMYRLAYRNFAGPSPHQTWLVNHSVDLRNHTTVGERWYEFRAPEASTTLTAFQQGNFNPNVQYRWMGSIAMDKLGDIAIGYSESGSTLYPSIYFTGRLPTDAAGTLRGERKIIGGTGSQTDTSSRWGDYTSMAIDVADDCTFWYTDQYYKVTTSFDWSTRIASIKFTACH